MNRRELLAACSGCACTSLAGCFADGPIADRVEPNPDDSGRDGRMASTDEKCGPGDASLSSLVTDDPGEGSSCFDGAMPDLVVENDRDDAISATISVAAGDDATGDTAFEETYDLEPGERIRERSPFEADADLEVVATVDGEPFEDHWGATSCRRHGVVISSDGIEAGWLEPLQGPADTQHDCYPGDGIPLEIVAVGRARSATVELVDRCDGSRFEATYDLEADERERIGGELESGGVYDVTITVDGGESETYEFDEGCWGLNAAIEADGSVRMSPFEID